MVTFNYISYNDMNSNTLTPIKLQVICTAKDLVCGMEANTAIKVAHKGKPYYFCNVSCKETFLKNPEKFSSRG